MIFCNKDISAASNQKRNSPLARGERGIVAANARRGDGEGKLLGKLSVGWILTWHGRPAHVSAEKTRVGRLCHEF